MPKPLNPFQDDYVKTALRLPRDLRDEIQAAAIHNGRSANSEMLARLRGSQDQRLATLERQLEEVKGMLRKLLDAAG